MSLDPGLHALACICVALALFAFLHHRRVKIGLALLGSACVLALLLGVTPLGWWRMIAREWREEPLAGTTPFLFVSLTGLVLLVNVLGTAMQETGVSGRLAPALRHLFRSRRAALATIPLLMGTLPTPGGIMLSAPMVRDLGDATGVDRARQAAINFFFRHQLETVWPLFPSVPLVQVLLQVPPARLLAFNLVIPLAGLASGIVFLLLFPLPAPAEGRAVGRREMLESVGDFLHAFWPIGVTAGLYAAFDVPAAVGILAAILAFLAFHKVPFRSWKRIFASALEGDTVLLILGALLYKLDLDAAHAVADITAFLQHIRVPVPVLIFSLPFLVGYVTGVTMPSVAMTFPLLKSFIGEGADAHMGLEVMAFAGVICGLYLTPVHLCLALSVSYFEVGLWRIIRLLIGPVLVIAATAFVMGFVAG